MLREQSLLGFEFCNLKFAEMLRLRRSQEFVRQSVLVAVRKDRPGNFDWIELESMYRLGDSEHEEREMCLRRRGSDLFLHIRRYVMLLLHRAVFTGCSNARFSREAVRTGILDEEGKSKDEYDGH